MSPFEPGAIPSIILLSRRRKIKLSKITQIEPQKTLRLRSGQGPKRFNIFLDGEFAFGADEDLVVEKRLVVGKILAATDLEQLLQEAKIGKLMEKVYRLFSIRNRSEKEIRDYFRIKNQESRIKEKEAISNLAVELVIKKLKQKGLLNDLEFAKAWVEARRRSKQKGNRLLQYELAQKGVARDIIDQVLSEQAEGTGSVTSYSQTDLASQALEKKMRLWQNLPKMEFKKKAYQYLGRKGFNFEIISEVIEKFLQKE